MSSVLWIEDQVDPDLRDLYAYAVATGHDITVAEDIAEAISVMGVAKVKFDCVIVDLRVPTGQDQAWLDFNKKLSRYPNRYARLGAEFVRALLRLRPRKGPHPPAVTRPVWLKKEIIGILSVETLDDPDNVRLVLNELGIPPEHYMRKWDTGDPSPRLNMLVNRVIGDATGSQG